MAKRTKKTIKTRSRKQTKTQTKANTKATTGKVNMPISLGDAMGALGFLGSHKGMFAGMRSGLGVGDKAIVIEGKKYSLIQESENKYHIETSNTFDFMTAPKSKTNSMTKNQAIIKFNNIKTKDNKIQFKTNI